MKSIVILSCLLFFWLLKCRSQENNLRNNIEWRKDVLDFTNFRIISDYDKADSLPMGATTYSKTYYAYSESGKNDISLEVWSRFNYEKSWMRKKCVGNIALLKHEQLHFDIEELYGRIFADRCIHAEIGRGYDTIIPKIYSQALHEAKATQLSYDTETNHGLNTLMQKYWKDKIAKSLDSLQTTTNHTFHIKISSKRHYLPKCVAT